MKKVVLLGLLVGACATQPGTESGPSERSPAAWRGGPTRVRREVLELAYAQSSKPYVWDTNGPDSFDCSGLVHWVMRTTLGETVFDLPYFLKDMPPEYKATSVYYRDYLERMDARIECRRAKPADIVFFPANSRYPINHIGFVVDAKQETFFAAQSRKSGIKEDSYDPRSFWGSRGPVCYQNIWIER